MEPTTVLLILVVVVCVYFIVGLIQDDKEFRTELARLHELRGQIEEQHRRIREGQRVYDPSIIATAQNLVRHVLGEEQFKLLEENGYVDVPSKRYHPDFYRIQRSGQQGVQLVDAANLGFNASICILCPDQALPRDDQFLTLYMITKYYESRLLETGQVSWRDGRMGWR